MPFDVEIFVEPTYIRALLKGTRVQAGDVEVSKKVLSKISAASEENGLDDLLVIADLVGRKNLTATFQLISNPESLGWKTSYRVALVDTDITADEFHAFTQLVASNRGLQLHVFKEEALAIEWLMSK
ncbi:MAG: hypothetical protein HQ500_07035 [Flavobacteriales bacterium]|nr:hypothetical protein [Flavobacteriales bacterium]